MERKQRIQIESLIKAKDPKESVRFRLGAAFILSVLYTNILAYIIYGALYYPLPHMVFDYIYSFFFFIFLSEGYFIINRWLESRPGLQQSIYRKYIVGLALFSLFSTTLFTLIALVPFLLFMQPVGAINFGMELRLNYIFNLLVASVYYLCLVGFNTLRNYHHAVINSESLNREIAQAQYEGLKNQINPHFLFNSLNVLSSLVHVDANLSEKFIDQLAKAYRYVLEQRDHELVALKTELDFINSYIFLLKIRFEEKLQVRINIPAEKLNFSLPPLTLQLLVENAVKHNILSKDSPLVVEISVSPDDYLVVQNNLQIRSEEFASTGVGLKNISNRYKYLTDRKVNFHILGSSYVSLVPLLN